MLLACLCTVECSYIDVGIETDKHESDDDKEEEEGWMLEWKGNLNEIIFWVNEFLVRNHHEIMA
jgi:hypothetical protein